MLRNLDLWNDESEPSTPRSEMSDLIVGKFWVAIQSLPINKCGQYFVGYGKFRHYNNMLLRA